MMKVCVPKSEKKMSRHFGKAPEFAFYTIDNGQIVSTEIVQNPGREKGQVPQLMIDHQITHIVTVGIGDRAVSLLTGNHITIYPDAVGMVDTIMERFLNGELKPHKCQSPCAGENLCGSK